MNLTLNGQARSGNIPKRIERSGNGRHGNLNGIFSGPKAVPWAVGQAFIRFQIQVNGLGIFAIGSEESAAD
jgi:hypothetical protein